jgi:hypothetical protein
VVYATSTQGSWANRIVPPEGELEHLVPFYLQRLKLQFPISIWKSSLAPTESYDHSPETYGPNFRNYPLAFKPNIYVIDGTGKIRRVFIGAMSPERETQLVRLLQSLLHEQANSTTRTIQ